MQRAIQSSITKGKFPRNKIPTTSRKSSYKAIHYERQTQLKLRHLFNLHQFYKSLPHWCSTVNPSVPGFFVLKFEFVFPRRRKIKRHSLVFDLTSTKEFEASQAGLMYARSLFDIFVDEYYTCNDHTFTAGLQIGPSWIDRGKTRTCAVLALPSTQEISDMLTFATRAIFSSEELHHMEAITGSLSHNGRLLGVMDIPSERCTDLLRCAEKFYSSTRIQEVLYTSMKDRNVLYTFKNGEGLRQGMMIKTDDGWDPVEIKKLEDIHQSVRECGVVEFIPAVNRSNEDYPSIITIETDPGDMLVSVLGAKKSWVLNTYITEKIMRVLDRYRIKYMVKFSGNKGWHVLIPVELREPFQSYQEVVEAIVIKDLHKLPDDEQMVAYMVNLMQLEDVKSYKDPFFVARRFVDLMGAHVMFFKLRDIHTILTLNDLKRCLLKVSPWRNARHDIFKTERGPVKVEIPQIVSINPYSKFRRQFKLLIDHSSNKKEGKIRSVFSLHSKTGLVSIPALLYTDEKGLTKFDEKMWDYDLVRKLAGAERVYDEIESEDMSMSDYPLLELARKWEVNQNLKGFQQFMDDHRGLLIYLLQNGGEALELLDTQTALWVNANLWKKTQMK